MVTRSWFKNLKNRSLPSKGKWEIITEHCMSEKQGGENLSAE